MDPIIHYLRIGTLSADNLAVHKVKHQAPHYVLLDDKLYKRSYSLPLLKCLLPSKADYAMREVHEGICGNHLRGRVLAYKILRQGYYWPTMQEDAVQYVKWCDAYQQHALVQH